MAIIDYGVMVDKMVAAGLPVDSIAIVNGVATVHWTVNPTQQQINQANAILADPLNARRKPRSLASIYNDISNLVGPDQIAIFTDLNSGVPKKYMLDTGPNAAAIVVLDWVVQFSGASPANLNQAKARLITLYVQDNPRYLNHPPFSPTLNIDGDDIA